MGGKETRGGKKGKREMAKKERSPVVLICENRANTYRSGQNLNKQTDEK